MLIAVHGVLITPAMLERPYQGLRLNTDHTSLVSTGGFEKASVFIKMAFTILYNTTES